MHQQTHNLKHKNHAEYTQCKNTYINIYVDDCFSIVETNGRNIWNLIEIYIKKMNTYYINIFLQMNVKKTNVMLITNIKEELEGNVTIDGNLVENSDNIKILGIVFNNKLNWNNHILNGSSSLINQLKQRLNSLKIISKTISANFAKQMANAILMSKINYNIEVWGNTNNNNKNKIDKILLEASRTVLGREAYGRTKAWMLHCWTWIAIFPLCPADFTGTGNKTEPQCSHQTSSTKGK